MQSKLKQNQVFSLILELYRSLHQKMLVLIISQVIYAVEFLGIFLAATNSDNETLIKLLQSFELLMPLLSIVLVIIAQIVVAYKTKVHFQLLAQLYLFRYSVVPMLLLFLAAEIKAPYYLPVAATCSLMALLVLVTYFLSAIVFIDLSESRVAYSSSEYSRYFIFTEMLMVLCFPLHGTKWINSIFLCWLFMAFIINKKMSKQIIKNDADKLLGFIFSFENYLMVILVATFILGIDNSDFDILTFSSVILPMLFAYHLCMKKKEQFSENVFDGSASLEEFFNFVYIVSSEMSTVKSNLNLNFQDSLLSTVITLHERTCPNPRCLLLQASTQDELLNSNEINNRKILLYKITKTIQFVFKLYAAQNLNNEELSILKLSFISVHLMNKIKIRKTITQINYEELNIQTKLLVFCRNERASLFQSAEMLDNVQDADDEYDIFKKKLMELLLLLREFWSALRDDKVDVNTLIRISSKLFPLKKEVESVWKKNIRFQNYSTWNIIKTYAFYCRSILHDNTRACIFEDYCKILEHRMRAKQELSYIKHESEAGVIAISLTQYSLGRICSSNLLASRIFNYYSKEEITELRVNDIMPSVFSIVHDDILNSYLKNRYKKINQDERLVLGKNKNGFIFPMHLQLRKLSWNTNDELIFISNVKSTKLRSAPINCIVNLEGEIQDVSSSFAWMFFKKSISQMTTKTQNIQWLLPSFFRVIEETEMQQDSRFIFEEKCQVKKTSGDFDVEFTGSVMIIKQAKVGYLLEGRRINTIATTSLQEKKKISEMFIENQDFRNFYNPLHRCYQISNRNQSLSISNSNEFTIPFMRTDDIEKIFKFQGGEPPHPKEYGRGIRTFRLINNRIEMAVEEESFQSDEDNEGWREFSVIKNIKKMREDLNITKRQNMTNFYIIVVVIMGTLLLSLCGILILKSISFSKSATAYHHEIQDKWLVRSLLPEILVYTYFPSSINNYTNIKDLRYNFFEALSYSKIQEWKKQSMIRILHLSDKKVEVSFENDLFNYTNQDLWQQQEHALLKTLEYVLVSLQFFYCLILVCMFLYFQHCLHDIYTVFLSVNDKKLRVILNESHKLMDFIAYNPFKILDIAPSFESKKKEEDQSDEDEDRPFKKFKKNSQAKNINLAYKMMAPMLILVVFGLFCSVFIALKLDTYDRNVEIWKKGGQIFPESSLLTVEELFKHLDINGTFNQTTIFYDLQKQYEADVIRSDIFSQQLFHYMTGDPCIDGTYFHNLPDSIINFCQGWTPTSDFSLLNNLNLLSSFLRTNTNRSDQNWLQMIQIQFALIKPLIGYALTEIREILRTHKQDLIQDLLILAIINITLIIVGSFYLIWFPITEMGEKIIFAKDLMSIIPTENVKKPKETLATLTTEAIEIKEITE